MVRTKVGLCATATALGHGFGRAEGLMATIDDFFFPGVLPSSGFEHRPPWEEKIFHISSYPFFFYCNPKKEKVVEKEETK
ncbi:hypothetical protein TIFTF001_000588 [Ficus carica]|uniref:Uncharacterized protein n=1 Tax=Ficus carica TaxID=3494 RepID=A0AA87YWC6_FICCA|nr:hypothetical protein TIFTF001_000588 [Ficus carica]